MFAPGISRRWLRIPSSPLLFLRVSAFGSLEGGFLGTESESIPATVVVLDPKSAIDATKARMTTTISVLLARELMSGGGVTCIFPVLLLKSIV